MSELLLVDDRGLAKMLNIPISSVNYLARKKKIPYIWVGRHRRFEPKEVIRNFKQNGNN